ncbi:MAG TPA: FtsX-like permease family protein, partial [Blastocatellia bacterium]|nr:FtsX-like permease family protein [Blastocatellia bacterium]
LAAEYPDDKGFGVTLIPMREAVAGSFRTPLLALAGALAFVLLLTCTNIANLQLVRLEGRRKELALRTALGAEQFDLIRQILAEVLMLVIVAGVLGIMLAPTGVRLLLSLVPPDADSWLSIKTDKTVLMVSMVITLLTALVSGLIPALKISRASLKGALSAGWGAVGTGGVNGKLRSGFLIAQLALAVIPLTGAGLLVSSLMNLEKVDPGFQSDHRLTMSFYAPRARYKDHDKLAQLAEQVADQSRHIPGVKDAGVSQYLPFTPSLSWVQAISLTDPKQNQHLAELPHIKYAPASTDFFEAMGIPIKSGRVFQQSDDQNAAPVAVINEALAKKYFPNEDPIGKQVWLGHAQLLPTLPPRTIIGVVGDIVINSLDESPRTAAWVPITQQTFFEDVWRSLYIVVHTNGEPQTATSAIREEMARIDPDLALADIATMDERMSQSLWRNRLTAVTMGSLGIIAVFIAMLGVFGVTSYLVTQRSHEIGVRIAIGAQRHHIYQLIMGQGLVLIASGIVIGIVGSLLLTQWLASLLYEVGTKDPVTLTAVSLLLAGAGLLACYIPARRATRVDPLITLRTE